MLVGFKAVNPRKRWSNGQIPADILKRDEPDLYQEVFDRARRTGKMERPYLCRNNNIYWFGF